jgi:hypothetical protein
MALTLYRLASIFVYVATEVIVTAEFAAWEGLSLTVGWSAFWRSVVRR